MKYVVWDWNGTLLDDVSVSIASMNELLGKYGLPLLEGEEDYRSKFTFPVIDYYRTLGFDFDKKPFEVVGREFIERYHQLCHACPLTEGAEGILAELDRRGYGQIILSASKRDNLLKQMATFDIASYFTEVLGLSHIYAASKVELARGWVRENHADRLTVIGDTYHDLAVAEELGADCLLYSRGHQAVSEDGAKRFRVVDDMVRVLDFL